MKKKMLTGLAIGLLTIGMVGITNAAIVTHEYSGSVAYIGSALPTDSFSIGDHMSVFFSYDTEEPDLFPEWADHANYNIISYTLNIGTHSYTATAPGIAFYLDQDSHTILVEDLDMKGDALSDGQMPTKSRFQLWDPTASVLIDESLLEILPPLSLFDLGSGSYITLRFTNALGTDHQVRGQIDPVPIPEPNIEIDPVEYNFGNVVVGTPTTMIATIYNTGGGVLNVDNISINGSSAFNFALQSTLPVALEHDQMVEIEITCDPSTLYDEESATLTIANDDPDIEDQSKTIFLTCAGVLSDNPSETVQGLLDYIEQSIVYGTLEGDGPGNSAEKRLNALINMIESAGDLIDEGNISEACDQLQSIYKKVDGLPKPPDFVNGSAVSDIEESITQIMNNLGCS